MRLVLLGCVLLTRLLLAADEAQVRALVAQLGADEPAAREEATKALAKLGGQDDSGVVERLLDEAARSDDAEVVTRAHDVLDHIRYWNRLVLVGGAGTGAVDLTSGEYAWTRPQVFSAYAGPRQRGAVAWLFERDEGLQCLDLRAGRLRWKARAPGWGEVVEGKYWLGFGGTDLARISLENGAVDWSLTLPEPIARVRPASLFADGEGVFVETEKQVLALDAATGKERWRGGGELLGLSRDGVYVSRKTDDKTRCLLRLDPKTGAEVWSRPSPPDHRPEGFVDVGGGSNLILVADGPEDTAAIDAATGKDAWRLPNSVRSLWTPADGRQAWLLTENEILVAALSSGQVLSHFPRDMEEASLLGDRDTLYVAEFEEASCGVTLRALDVPARKQRWQADVEGVQVGHSKYWQKARVERLGDRLLFVVEAAGGCSVEVIDPATGKVTSRIHPK